MWEIALLIVAVGFLGLVVFTVPALLQVRDTAKELEFTLREAREVLRRVRAVAEKAEEGVDRGREVLDRAGHALSTVDSFLGRGGTRAFSRGLGAALEWMPVVMGAVKLFQRHRARSTHEGGE